jgi:hypothetical protein
MPSQFCSSGKYLTRLEDLVEGFHCSDYQLPILGAVQVQCLHVQNEFDHNWCVGQIFPCPPHHESSPHSER